jgi:hypothetical protein
MAKIKPTLLYREKYKKGANISVNDTIHLINDNIDKVVI